MYGIAVQRVRHLHSVLDIFIQRVAPDDEKRAAFEEAAAALAREA